MPRARPIRPAALRLTAAATAALVLYGCAAPARPPAAVAPEAPAGMEARETAEAAATAEPSAVAETDARTPAATAVEPPARERTLRGNDRVVAPARAQTSAGVNTTLRFESAPLGDVTHAILRELMRVNYVIHPPLNGTVTLASPQPIPAERALALLEAALQANGYQLVRDAAGTYHVGKPEQLRAIVPGVAVLEAPAAPLPAGQGVLVVPLRYIGAAEMASILRPFAPEGAIVRVDALRNLLVLVGARAQLDGWLDLVRTFDVNLLDGMSVGVFPLQHISARDVDGALRALANPGAAALPARPAPAPSGTPAPGGAAQAAAPALTEGAALIPVPVLGAIRVLPLERANAVVVVTPRAEYLDLVRDWIGRLDQPGLGGNDQQLFVYRVQNGNARHLAEVLAGLFGAGQPQPPQPTSGVAPGAVAQTVSSAGGASLAALPASAGQAAQPATAPAVTLAGGLRIMADQYNNAILVWGSPGQYRQVEQALKRLDLAPTQVLIEATIVEVQLVDDLKYGIQWFFTDRHGGNSGSGVLDALANLGGAQGAFTYTLRGASGNIRAVLNALAEKSLIKVISSPSLMVLDNHTASIVVGNQQPVRTAETVTTGGNVTTAITYKDTGVALTVTPSVNAGETVTLQLQQAVTDVGAIDSATGQRAFLQRQIGSRVAVRSGETLVLGGLIRDNNAAGSAGLPLAKDIPLLGWLFGAQSRSANRTELLVLITPRVLRSAEAAAEAAREARQRMATLLQARPYTELPPVPGLPAAAPAAPAEPVRR